ncbi:hypothetical protein, partial [Prevotella corporis]
IPKVIESHEKEMAKVVTNKDVYTNIANSSWKKEDELRSLKGEAAELDRKIALTLNEPNEENEKSNENDQPEYLRQNSSNSPNTKKEEEGVIYSSSMNNRNKQEESKGYIVKSRLR